MNLTVRVTCRNGEYVATADELPTLEYKGAVESEVRERMEKLARALASPYVKLVRVEPTGEVILTISRGHFEPPDDETTFPKRRRPISLQEARDLCC